MSKVGDFILNEGWRTIVPKDNNLSSLPAIKPPPDDGRRDGEEGEGEARPGNPYQYLEFYSSGTVLKVDAEEGCLRLLGAQGRRFILHTVQIMGIEVESQVDHDTHAHEKGTSALQMVTWVKQKTAVKGPTGSKLKTEQVGTGTTCCALHAETVKEAGIRQVIHCRCFLSSDSLTTYNVLIQEATSRLGTGKQYVGTKALQDETLQCRRDEEEALLLLLSALDICDDDINLHRTCAMLGRRMGLVTD